MKIRMAVAAALVGGLMLSEAQALSLGDLKVRSALHQPLKAEINLFSLESDGNLATARPSLADPALFQRLKLFYPDYLNDIIFNVQQRGEHTFIVLTSKAPWSAPVTALLLEVEGGGEKTIKKFVLRLPENKLVETGINENYAISRDYRPSFMQAQPAAGDTQQPAPSLVPGVENTDITQPTYTTTVPAPQQTHTVKGGETLYKIAARLKPAGISTDRMMLAIMRNNQQAFPDGDGNQLHIGERLRIPDAQQASEVTAAQARQFKLALNRVYLEKQASLKQAQAGASSEQKAGAAADQQAAAGTTHTATDQPQSVVAAARPQAVTEKAPVTETGAAGSDGEQVAPAVTQPEQKQATLAQPPVLEQEQTTSAQSPILEQARQQLASVQRELTQQREYNERLQNILRQKNRLLSQRDELLRQYTQAGQAPLSATTNPVAQAQTESQFVGRAQKVPAAGEPAVVSEKTLTERVAGGAEDVLALLTTLKWELLGGANALLLIFLALLLRRKLKESAQLSAQSHSVSLQANDEADNTTAGVSSGWQPFIIDKQGNAHLPVMEAVKSGKPAQAAMQLDPEDLSEAGVRTERTNREREQLISQLQNIRASLQALEKNDQEISKLHNEGRSVAILIWP